MHHSSEVNPQLVTRQLATIEEMLDLVLRSTVIYFAIIIGLRFAGKRHLGQLSLPDFVLILLVSNAVQNAMVGNDSSLPGGLIAAGTLIVLNVIVSQFLFRSRAAKNLVEGSPVMLIYNGRLLRQHLDSEEVTEEELLGVIREHGFSNVDEVHTAVLEVDGTISIVGRSNANPKQTQPIARRKMKFRHRP